MDALEIPEMCSCFVDRFVNRKKREMTSCESPSTSPPLAKKKIKEDDENSQTSRGVSPSSSEEENSSRKDVTPPLGILMASGERTEEEEGETTMKCVSHGLISVIGRRRSMEDAVTVAVDGEVESYDFFAVYDGHGGSHVANMCRDRLHSIVAEEVEETRRKTLRLGDGGERGLDYWAEVMASSFSRMDEEVSGGGGETEYAEAVKSVGSTAVVVMVGEQEVVVANCGDSRAVLYRRGRALPLSCDHKPDRPDEKGRVEAAGGWVINWNGSRVLGVLATSRSIGDQYLKPYVISEPEVIVSRRTESDEFIVIASDGLWDVLTNELACEVVRRCLKRYRKSRYSEKVSGSRAAQAAALLAELAMARGSRDNISVIVVELKRDSSSSSSSSS